MFLWWRPQLVQFYNDAYRPSIREDKHPAAIGQKSRECWPEIWSIIGPQIESVMNEGCSTWNAHALVPINRNNKLEEVYWTYGYSPIRDEGGIVQGTLVVCSETTEQVLSQRRLQTLLQITGASIDQREFTQTSQFLPFARAAVEQIAGNPSDIPFAAMYLLCEEDIFHVAIAEKGMLRAELAHVNKGELPCVSLILHIAKKATPFHLPLGRQKHLGVHREDLRLE